MEPELKVILISVGVIGLGRILKKANIHVGNMTQGIGLGAIMGTIAHTLDLEKPCQICHHDKIGLAGLPISFILDKTNTIKSDYWKDSLYGISLGLLVQHGMTEGCSWCGTSFCKDGSTLC